MNKITINNYLKSDVDPSILNPRRLGLVGLVKIENQNMSDIHLRLFKTKAMILWAQYKAQQNRKEGDSLKLVTTQLMVI